MLHGFFQIIIFHGEADDYVPMAPCREYVNRLQTAGANVKLIGYASAYHGFDIQGLPEKICMPNFQQAVKCRIKKACGNMINADTGKTISRSDACARIGGTVGYNKAAHQKSIDDVLREVKSVFKLESK